MDKTERGVRPLDRYPVIQEIARVLRVDPLVLLGEHRPPSIGAGPVDGVDGIRAALARYDDHRATASVVETGRHVAHAWLTYQHAHYAQVVRLLPRLLHAAQGVRAQEPGLLVQAYRITSSVLVKLGEPDLGWLAADRAMAVAGGDAVLAGAAAVSVGQALRALGRDRLALVATLAAARRVAPASEAVHGTLLIQAALAAAGCGDAHRTEELIERAAEVAAVAGDDPHRTGFGPGAVEAARVVAALELGDAGEAVRRHKQAVRGQAWRRLPAEHRAAYLVDAARAYLQIGDLRGAARALVDADAVAPAEVRCRPLARTVIAEVARAHPAPAGVARLATLVGLTR
ncbi:XRE family transcriptional regulator [Micromonospora peucetia]|uniref:XRE family transcriptional regulator n=1 Tax=Micromonospora peucetia TaxID=47871 RepID=A0ABZ1EFB7_9ACTN|nr:XRE family transcriptional regulator [Micromonospora peucetia]WSA32306.1 XRE family transcriptional regulator [Micromonospora peucetia]